MGTPMLGSHFWTKVENKVAGPNFCELGICSSSSDFYFLVIFKIGFEKSAKGQSQFANNIKGTYLLRIFLSPELSIALVFCRPWADLSKICCSSLMHICSGYWVPLHLALPLVLRALISLFGASCSALVLEKRHVVAWSPSWLAYSFLLGYLQDWFMNSYFVLDDL